MTKNAWRKTRFDDALARIDLRDRVRQALAAGPLCDHCLGRLMAGIDTGLPNAERGRRMREAVAGAAAPPVCSLCRGLFEGFEAWIPRVRQALEGWECQTFAVVSHADPAIEAAEEALWQAVGGDMAEPYKQAFNRLLGIRLCDETGLATDLEFPDIFITCHHPTGRVTLRVEPLFVEGRYRKVARGFPQCRWRTWRTSIQQIVGDPICREAGGEDHSFHGCGREDVDVLCLGERPFIVEVKRPHRRLLDWTALAGEIAAGGQVEVVDLVKTNRGAVERLKSARPQKSYRATVRLEADVDPAACERLASLMCTLKQHTPKRVLKRRANLLRHRRVYELTWRLIDPRTLELTVRAQAGTYIKELISGDSGRTRPSVAEVLGVAAECVELDVAAIHMGDENN